MGKTIQFIQQSLGISDEDMPAVLAGLYPKTSKIGDAAASFLDAANKLLTDDKTTLTIPIINTLTDAMRIAQEIVRQSAAMSRLIRNPYQTRITLMRASDKTTGETEEKTGEDETVDDEKAVA